MRNIREGKLLYHLTRLDNLESILETGLLSNRELKDTNEKVKGITDRGVIKNRDAYNLDKYVHFHFSPYTSYDYVKRNKYSDLIYICVHRDDAKKEDFKIIPKLDTDTDKVEIENFNMGMESIEWKYMGKCFKMNDEIRGFRRAECIKENNVPVDLVYSIYAKDQDTASKISEVIDKKRIKQKILVNVIPEFFSFDVNKY